MAAMIVRQTLVGFYPKLRNQFRVSASMTRLSLIHFNDVYRVQPQKLSSRSPETIDVTQFAALLDDIRDSWANQSKDGLVLFSGDLFSPSVESSVTRGSHMVRINARFYIRASEELFEMHTSLLLGPCHE
jgi:hypothetical protein